MDGREAFLVVESTKAVLYDSPPTRCPECVLQKSQSMFPDLPSRQNPLMTTPGSKFRHMSYTNRTRTSMEDGEFNINPEPVPYQPQNFMQTPLPRIGPESSTLLKKVPIPKRHLDSFGGYEYSLGSKRGVILHTDRYQWDAPKSFEGMSQRDRLRAELEYMERLRGIKRRREMLPHRAQLDLLMGGKKVEFSERFDIQREIQKLKSLIMPQNARDLFHGKGFHLPDEHSSLRPRRAPMLDYDSDEDTSVPSSHRLGKQAVDPDTGLPRSRLRQNIGQLPRIVNKNIIGMSPAYLKRSRTNVPSKMDPMVNRSTTLPPNDRQLNLSTRNDAVKRVEIPSAGALPKSRGTEKPEAMVDPDTNPLQIDNLKENLPEEDVAALERIESRLSGRSKLIDSPVKAATPNPLKGSELSHLLPEEKRDELKKTFQKLDTDADGHLMYQQIKSQLPPQMSVQQERFLKQVYDITSSSTFFGVDEFMTMSTLTKKVQDLKSESADSFGNLDFALLHDQIIKYVDLFQSVDRIHSGKISLESLQEVLSAALETDLAADDTNWNKILETVDPDEGAKISKIEFLAHIPYFLSLKLKPGPGALPHSQRFQ
uniref:EF-hand domain-containing protein n=2 Tax=Magallana gigas TaxID=29159 RepID=A0A8W8JFP5_MAGGI